MPAVGPRVSRLSRDALLVAGLLSAAAVQAAGFTPPSRTASMQVGTTLTFGGVFTTPAAGADKVDVFLLIDDTSSMAGVINNAKAGATSILNGLPSTFRYGVASYGGDLSEGVAANTAYNRRTDLTSDRGVIVDGINSIRASGGGDPPEANLYALQQVATTSSWDSGSQRVVVWFGDAPGHTETVTTSQAAAALNSVGAKTVALNSRTAGTGIDGRYSGEVSTTRQATDIVAVTGGSLTNNFASLSAAQFVSTVLSQITLSTTTFDLELLSGFSGSGLSVSVSCTDVQGCGSVQAGASRSFAVAVDALEVGVYGFDVGARGFSDVQHFDIAVTAVPEPASAALFLAGLVAFSASVGRGRRSQMTGGATGPAGPTCRG